MTAKLKTRNRIQIMVLWLITLLLLALSFGGCGVSKRVPNKELRAAKKLEKHLDAVTKITRMHPALVDTVTKDVTVAVSLDGDSIKQELKIDSAAIIAAFDDYDKQIIEADSLNKALASGLLSTQDSLVTHYELQLLKASMGDARFEVVKEIFKDTLIIKKEEYPLIIGKDTINLAVELKTVIKDGVPTTTTKILPIDKEVVVQEKGAWFKITKRLKLPWWVTTALVIGVLAWLAIWAARKYFRL